MLLFQFLFSSEGDSLRKKPDVSCRLLMTLYLCASFILADGIRPFVTHAWHCWFKYHLLSGALRDGVKFLNIVARNIVDFGRLMRSLHFGFASLVTFAHI